MRRACAALILLAATPAGAQQNSPSTGELARDVATTPLEDTNLRKRQIPVALEIAAENPYSADYTRNCTQLMDSLDELDAVLGPDFDNRDGSGRSDRERVAGVAKGIVGALIPFRGVIREVSGAAEARRRYEAAIDAGIARRGFLRGLAAQRKCKLRAPQPPATGPTE